MQVSGRQRLEEVSNHTQVQRCVTGPIASLFRIEGSYHLKKFE